MTLRIRYLGVGGLTAVCVLLLAGAAPSSAQGTMIRTADGRVLILQQDPIRAAEMQQRGQLSAARRQEQVAKMREQLQRCQFEAHFNQLVKAMSEFIDQYNQGKGIVWPQREAGKVRKAMRRIEGELGTDGRQALPRDSERAGVPAEDSLDSEEAPHPAHSAGPPPHGGEER